MGRPHWSIFVRDAVSIGDGGPNYSAEQVAETQRLLQEADLPDTVVIDCSHGNSGKDAARQPDVLRCVVSQRIADSRTIVGAMLESNLAAGSQPFPRPRGDLVYGQSITDACIDWETTERIALEVAEREGELRARS